MTQRIACFVMADPNHFRGVLPVVAELCRAGAQVRVWTDRRFAGEVLQAGAEHADLFAAGPLESIDGASRPLPVRFVSFAATRAAGLADDVAAWGATLVLYGSFALVGRVVAERLGLPRVAVTSGHAVEGGSFREKLRVDPRVDVVPVAHEAARRLREEFGLADASPFSYVADPSPWLNIYKEPEEWLSLGERARLGPLACFGSLSASTFASPRPAAEAGPLRIYASFGTIIWRYWPAQAGAALIAVAEAVSRRRDAQLSIGLGGGGIDPDTRARLAGLGARVEDYADQWAELASADLFVTHHGLGSTHEAVARGVPMLSYPIFWDQPALARRAQEFGLALPLVDSDGPLPGQLDPDAVSAAIDRSLEQRTAMLARLAEAQEWERRTIAGRPDVARRILAIER